MGDLLKKSIAITNEINKRIDDIVAQNKGLRKEGFVDAILRQCLWNDVRVKQAIAHAHAHGNLGARALEKQAH